MSAITTHVLDTSRGCPAAGLPVLLEIRKGKGWQPAGKATTDDNGRIHDLLKAEPASGTYRLKFDVDSYFRSHNSESFYPEVVIVFTVDDPARHYHVPLLLSPWGYTTYRGS